MKHHTASPAHRLQTWFHFRWQLLRSTNHHHEGVDGAAPGGTSEHSTPHQFPEEERMTLVGALKDLP